MDLFRLDGKVVLITGGANGIGLATASLCRAAGATVVLLDRDAAALAAAEVGGAGAPVERRDARRRRGSSRSSPSCSELARTLGRIDVLVNNAGIAIRDAAVRLSRAAVGPGHGGQRDRHVPVCARGGA